MTKMQSSGQLHTFRCVVLYQSISKTLHLISKLQNQAGDLVGLSIRVGKTIRGLVQIIDDAESKTSILLCFSCNIFIISTTRGKPYHATSVHLFQGIIVLKALLCQGAAL